MPARVADLERADVILAAVALTGCLAAAFLSTQPPMILVGAAGGIAAIGLALAAPRVFVLGLLPLMMLVPPTIRLPFAGLPDFTPLRLTVLLGIVVWLFLLSDSRRPRARRMPIEFIITAVAFSGYVVLVAGLGNPTTLSRALGYSVEALAPVWLVWVSVRSKRDLLLFVDWLLVLVAIASLVALWEAVTQTFVVAEKLPYFFHAPARGGGIRIQGIFPHPLVLGAVLALALPVGVTRIATARRERRIVAAVATGVMLIALFFTSSRGPWLAAAAAVTLLGALLRGGARLGVVAGIVALIPAIVFSPAQGKVATLLRGLIDPQAGQAAGAYTVDYRRELWHFTTSYAGQHPFGAGAGKSSDLVFYSVVGGNATNIALSIDNAFAKYSIELGVVGLALFVLLLVAVLYRTWTGRRTSDRDLSAVASAMFAGQMGMLVTSFTVATFSWAQLSALFWLFVGAGLAVGRLGTGRELAPPAAGGSGATPAPSAQTRPGRAAASHGPDGHHHARPIDRERP